jgi:DNA replication licensing factor MCM7
LEGLNLNGNDDDPEYDMLDRADDPAPHGARSRGNKQKLKYIDVLQEVSNRERDEVVIDLNDVEAVSRRGECEGLWS